MFTRLAKDEIDKTGAEMKYVYFHKIGFSIWILGLRPTAQRTTYQRHRTRNIPSACTRRRAFRDPHEDVHDELGFGSRIQTSRSYHRDGSCEPSVLHPRRIFI